ncbi:MAG: hypothetical protein C4557_00960 [Anaerolineaceae bacterium]|jgi:hypothetical protein|nr:MAG: hypothetical protein C4557_00960 [Anaerolineaceae bacterium]
MTTESFRLFMSRIIDYAGLYPPANLSLEDAFRNFVEFQDSPDSWMLSRFVIPAKRLPHLSPLMPDSVNELSFTALGRSGASADEFLSNLELDIADIQAFRETHSSRVLVDMFETALPASALNDTIHNLVKTSSDLLNKTGLTVFFEAPFDAAQDKPFGEGWQSRVDSLVRALRKLKNRRVGFKLRTGGVIANMFPSAEQIARAIVSVRDAGVPIKCTAGLHHPIRHFNESVQTKMHGFLNVFGAGILAAAKNLSQAAIQSILEDEDPENFTFDSDGFAWKGLRAAASEIAKARLFAVSFGSCSFDEPREDLRELFRGRDAL